MNINFLKTAAIIALGLNALNVSAASTSDLANFGRYADDNRRVIAQPNTGSRVVFMGNSITDFWPGNLPRVLCPERLHRPRHLGADDIRDDAAFP